MPKFHTIEFLIGCIARELLIVDPETVTLGIGIDKETSLEEGIWRRLNVRNHVGRREGQLVHCQTIMLVRR